MAKASAISDQRSAMASRPLLKWAGGKRQLLPQLRRFQQVKADLDWGLHGDG